MPGLWFFICVSYNAQFHKAFKGEYIGIINKSKEAVIQKYTV